MKRIKAMSWLGVGGALLLPALAVAALEIPNTFSAGDPVSASEMNANFEAVKAKVDELETQLSSVPKVFTRNSVFAIPDAAVGQTSYCYSYDVSEAGFTSTPVAVVQLAGISGNGDHSQFRAVAGDNASGCTLNSTTVSVRIHADVPLQAGNLRLNLIAVGN